MRAPVPGHATAALAAAHAALTPAWLPSARRHVLHESLEPRRTRSTTPAAPTIPRVPRNGGSCTTHPRPPSPTPHIHPPAHLHPHNHLLPTLGRGPIVTHPLLPHMSSRRCTDALILVLYRLGASYVIVSVKFHVFPAAGRNFWARRGPGSGVRPDPPADEPGVTLHARPVAIRWHPAGYVVRWGTLGPGPAEIAPRRAMPSPSKPIAGPGSHSGRDDRVVVVTAVSGHGVASEQFQRLYRLHRCSLSRHAAGSRSRGL